LGGDPAPRLPTIFIRVRTVKNFYSKNLLQLKNPKQLIIVLVF